MDNREERIRQKAHQIWEQAGRPADMADQHWSDAERQIDNEDHKGDTDALANEPSRPQEAIDIAPSPTGDIHRIPTSRRA
jgi:hypothetical protein